MPRSVSGLVTVRPMFARLFTPLTTTSQQLTGRVIVSTTLASVSEVGQGHVTTTRAFANSRAAITVLPTFDPALLSARNALAIVFKSKRLKLGLVYASALITIKGKALKVNLVVAGDMKLSTFYDLHMYSICVWVRVGSLKTCPGHMRVG